MKAWEDNTGERWCDPPALAQNAATLKPLYTPTVPYFLYLQTVPIEIYRNVSIIKLGV